MTKIKISNDGRDFLAEVLGYKGNSISNALHERIEVAVIKALSHGGLLQVEGHGDSGFIYNLYDLGTGRLRYELGTILNRSSWGSEEAGGVNQNDEIIAEVRALKEKYQVGVLAEIHQERRRQRSKGFNAEHDKEKTPDEWVQLITDYAGWARVMAGMGSRDKYRNRLMQVAAIAVAAIESLDSEISVANARGEIGSDA